jgi:AraC-like DNA-binding protein
MLLFEAVRQSLSDKPFRTLRDLSRQLRVSMGTVEHAVSASTQGTFRSFREEILVNHLTDILGVQPTCTIKEIALTVGYKSPRSFARAVKRICGLSPQELRWRIAQRLASDDFRCRLVRTVSKK